MNNQIDLTKLNDRHQYEQFRDVNFTGKHITKIKFNNISFLNCDFTGAVISICDFDNKCEFVNCKFIGTTILNCVFSNTTILECEFSKVKFEDVAINDTCNLIRNEFLNDCIVKNFTVRGAEVDDITQLVFVNVATDQDAAEQVNESVEDAELESRQDPEVDFKLYNALFPQILKQYPFEKDEYGVGLTVDSIEFGFGPDSDSSAWRYVFLVKDTDDSLGSDVVIVDTTKEITFDTLKEAFENTIKGEAESIIDRSSSPVIKRSIEKFLQILFGTVVEATETIGGSVVVETSASPESVTGFLTTGYDNENKKTVIIVGKPFVTENVAEANEVREKITKAGFMINEDITHLTADELHKYAQENPYSCFVYEHSDMMDRVSIRPFGKSKNIVMK